jgi:predicted metal-dependent hydrolase
MTRNESEPTPPTVEIIRSERRKKTAQGRMVGSRLEIRVPARMSKSEVDRMVDHFVGLYERQQQAGAVDLDIRAVALAKELDLPTPTSIKWVSNQRHRWGSCTPSRSSIRLSDRMIGFPAWVIDYVIVHELAHLRVVDHSPEFWALVERYPLSERARGYLIAKGGED